MGGQRGALRPSLARALAQGRDRLRHVRDHRVRRTAVRRTARRSEQVLSLACLFEELEILAHNGSVATISHSDMLAVAGRVPLLRWILGKAEALSDLEVVRIP